MSTWIKQARLIDPANDFDGVIDVLIDEGRIARIGEGPESAEEVIDAQGQWLLPGLVDLSARLGEPGHPQRGTIASETGAAAAAGITTMACPPDSDPVLDNSAAAHHLNEKIKADARVRVVPIGALTRELGGERLSDMEALRRAGCAGVSNALAPVRDAQVLRKALQYAASLDLTVHLAPMDPWLTGNGIVHDGRTATRLGLAGIPEAAELAALARDLVLIRDTGVKAHIGRLSCAASVEMIVRARSDGLQVTSDVAMHQLFLTELDLIGFDERCHLVPPLRTQRDRDQLRLAVASGAIDAVCSDHMPLDRDAKLAPFPETEPGLSGLETLLALGLRLVDEEVLPVAELVRRLTRTPAAILGRNTGHLAIGQPADLILVDPDRVWTLDPNAMQSHGHSTPFAGWEFRGRVMRTWVGGDSVFQR